MGDKTRNGKKIEEQAQEELITKLHDSLAKTKSEYARLEIDHAEIQRKFLEWENDHL